MRRARGERRRQRGTMTTDNSVRELRDETVMPPPPGDRSRSGASYPPDDRWATKAAYYPDDPRRKSPALATIMSLMPGLGQVYVGYYQQGFTNILVVAGTITLLANSGDIGLSALQPLLGVFLAFYWLYNLVDAGRRATFYNQALAGVGKVTVPEDLRLPSGGGSLAGGVALVVLGVIIFSNTMYGISLRWLEQWWPLGLVAGGAYLIYSSLRDRRKDVAGASSGTEA